jgi:hypothetical protein
MLERTDRIEVADGLTLPVVQTEDIIGLKIQATVNSKRMVWLDSVPQIKPHFAN